MRWETNISAPWKRALECKEIRYASGSLRMHVEEEQGRQWFLEFGPVQAWRVTAEECVASISAQLPNEGALFLVQQSDWLEELSDGRPLVKSRHFVVCCYDEIVEVLAWDCSITSAYQGGKTSFDRDV